MFSRGPSRSRHHTNPSSLRSTLNPITYLRNQQIYSSLSHGHSKGTIAMDTEVHQTKRSYRTLATGVEKIYMGLAAFEAIVVFAIAFTGFGLVQANIEVPNVRTRTVPVYLANFIFAQVFSVVYIFDALRQRNVIQLCLHLFFNLCILLYSILQIFQTKNAFETTPQDKCGSYPRCIGPDSLYDTLWRLYLVTPIVVGLCTIAFAFMIRKLYIEFGWAVFHLVGASPQMKRMHREYETLLSLLKMVFFFATAFCLAYLILVTNIKTQPAEFIITIIALPMTPITILACAWALRKENRPVMGTCLALMFIGLVYFIYKLASMFLPRTATLYKNTKITMVIFAVFTILILMVTLAFGCICFSNFGKGLLQAHRNPENTSNLWAVSANTNTKYPEKVRADVEAEQPQPVDRLVID